MAHFQARSCQFVWFFGDTQHLSADALLEGVTGLRVDSVQKNRAPTMASPFTSQAANIQDGLSRSFTVTPGRVDFVVTPAPVDEIPQDVLLVDAQAVLGAFTNTVAAKNLEHLQGASRFAVVVNYLRKVENLAAAQAELLGWLGIPLPDGYVSDLLFQINKRTTVLDGSVEVNRLLQFRNEVMKLLEMQPATILGLLPSREVSEETFLSIVADVNTVPEKPLNLSSADMYRAFSEMSDEALRIPTIPSIGAF